jgi:transcriptional regulator with XRE-family HTH domain
MSDVRSLLALNMKRYREVLGLSQAALAERVGCSATLIGNIEIQKRFPSAENIDRIASALGIKTADLFAEKDTAFNTMKLREEVKSKLEHKILKVLNEVFSDTMLCR